MIDPLRDKPDDAMGALLRKAKEGGELPRPGSRERVWRQLEQPTRPSPAWWLVPAAVAAAVVAAVFFFGLSSSEPQPFATVTLASGDVQASDGASWSVAKVGQALSDGSTLRVAPRARAYARMPGAGALFREGTTASLSKRQLSLAVGTLVAASSTKVRARALEYSVDVESAVFQLEAAADAVTLQVSEGQARVLGPDTDVIVRAGESWSSKTGKGRAQLSPAEIATARALATGTGDEAVLRIAKPAGAQVTLDGVELGTAPLEVMVKRGAHELEGVQGSLRTSLKATVGGNAPTIVELPEPKELPLPQVSFEPDEPDAAPEPTPEAAPKRVDPPADPARRYMLARSLAHKARYAEAVQIYEGLAGGTSGWAEPALYEVGRVNLRAKKFSAAATALADYRARYPKGSLAHEVALSSIEVQLKLGAGAAALAAMDDFLARFPASERHGDVRFLRATVRRDRGDCAGAAADYLALLDDPVHGDDALYFAAVCEQQLGEELAARRHLTEYLKRFPAGSHAPAVRRFFEGGPGSGNSPPP